MNLLPRDPARRTAVLVAFLAVSGAYFVHTYVHAPRGERAETRENRLRLVETGNAAADVQAADARGLATRVAQYRTQLERLEGLVPSEGEVASLLDAISASEVAAGVEVATMRPEPIQPGRFFDHWSYEIEVRGGYHAVGSFLTRVASMERILVPDAVTIVRTAPAGPDPGPHDGNVTARFRIGTHVVTPGGQARMPSAEEPRDTAEVGGEASPAGPLVLERERFTYAVSGRRDPFQPPAESPVDEIAAAGLRVLGIIYHEIPRYSLVLVQARGAGGVTPDAETAGADQVTTHRLRPGDQLGPLRVVRVQRHRVTVEIADESGRARHVIEVARPSGRRGT